MGDQMLLRSQLRAFRPADNFYVILSIMRNSMQAFDWSQSVIAAVIVLLIYLRVAGDARLAEQRSNFL